MLAPAQLNCCAKLLRAACGIFRPRQRRSADFLSAVSRIFNPPRARIARRVAPPPPPLPAANRTTSEPCSAWVLGTCGFSSASRTDSYFARYSVSPIKLYLAFHLTGSTSADCCQANPALVGARSARRKGWTAPSGSVICAVAV